MNHRSGGNAPKEFSSRLIELNVILYPVQPKGSSKRKAVCDNDHNEDADAQSEFLLL